MGTNHSALLSAIGWGGAELGTNRSPRRQDASPSAVLTRQWVRRGPRWFGVLFVLATAALARADDDDPTRVVERMRSAYARVSDYQMRVESTTYSGEAVQEETRILYQYKKPGKIRIDFLRPREGWSLVYPSDGGKVRVRPAGLLHFLKLHLDPDSSLLTVWPGQQVTRTDLGSLVENIATSLTGGRLGPADVSRAQGELVIRVEAQNHFLKGVPTRYEFRIDTTRWFPTAVREELLSMSGKREIRFQDLRTDVGLADSLFRLP